MKRNRIGQLMLILPAIGALAYVVYVAYLNAWWIPLALLFVIIWALIASYLGRERTKD